MTMRLRSVQISATVLVLGLVFGLELGGTLVGAFGGVAIAQTQTTGGIRGQVIDDSGQPMLLVTVVATSPNLQGTQSELTDADGYYRLADLPPGTYSLLFVYEKSQIHRDNIEVGLGKLVVVNATIHALMPEVITIKERSPAIDSGSTNQSTHIQSDYLKNVPARGRTYAGVIDAAAGAQTDLFGQSFSGSGSVENSYVVDGMNTSGVSLGQFSPTQGSQILNNFIQEIEIITGGYNAEYGRSTGGVVNVITKSGTNEFHGSVFANVNALNAGIDPIPVAGSAIRSAPDPTRNIDFGFELGGPIVPDKIWFYVGFAPVLQTQSFKRIVSTAVDRRINNFNYDDKQCARRNFDGTCDGDGNPMTTAAGHCELHRTGEQGACEGDGNPDIDPATGFPAYEEIDHSTFGAHNYTYQFMGKLNFAVSPEHQGAISLTGQPSASALVLQSFPNGTLTATTRNQTELNTDLTAKWSSKFFDNKTQIDVTAGWHRYNQDQSPLTDTLPGDPSMRTVDVPQLILTGPYATLGIAGRNHDIPESPLVQNFCADNDPRDEFPSIVNCPDPNNYSLNSLGYHEHDTEQRVSGKIVLTERFAGLGHHTIKVGADVESNYLDSNRGYTGGYFLTNVGDTTWQQQRFANFFGTGNNCENTDANGNPVVVPCQYLDSLTLSANTLNWGAFVQDGWNILPNLTIDLGVRYEQQRLSYPTTVQSELDPMSFDPVRDPTGLSGTRVGTYALSLNDLLAPRVGIIYDWTHEGRSKLYASWGRFFESIPMDINNRTFGSDTQGIVFYDNTPDGVSKGDCGGAPGPNDPRTPTNPYNCPTDPTQSPRYQKDKTLGGGAVFGADAVGRFDSPPGVQAIVMPGTGAQYMDELTVGVEYEVLPDLTLGLAYQNRRLGNVVEDMSTDGANSYFVGNPGSFDEGEANKLLAQINQFEAADPMDPRIQGLIQRLNSFTAVRNFDAPVRVYNAVQVTAKKRFSRSFMIQGSYTYSRLEGNFPGLFSPDTAQLDPNMTTQYDLYELLANRAGALPADRPHNLKLDGYYTFDFQSAGALTIGARLRAQSGIPYTALASQVLYGQYESFLLPRGSSGRTPFETNADLHVGYARRLATTELSVYFEFLNLFNNQTPDRVDQQYTLDAADPIIGGSSRDLYYAKPVWSPNLAGLGFPSGSLSGGPNGQYSGLSGQAQASQPILPKLNFGQPVTRLDPLGVRIGASLSF